MLVLSFMALNLLPTTLASCPANAAPFLVPNDISEAEAIRYANWFEVKYHSTYKVIQFNPTMAKYQNWYQIPELKGQKIPDVVLYQCGTIPPTNSFNDVPEDALFFSVPIERAALGWGGMLHFWEMLSVTENIHAIDMAYITLPCTQLLEVCTPGIHADAPSTGAAVNADWNSATAGADEVFGNSFGEGFTNTKIYQRKYQKIYQQEFSQEYQKE